MKVTFYFVRHGQTLFNTLGRIQGKCDSPLTDEGIAGAQDTASALRHVPFTYACASSSERAWKTAEIICAYHGLKPVRMKDLKEYDFGELDGHHFSVFKRLNLETGMNDDWTAYHGESKQLFKERTDKAFQKILNRCHDGETVLIVSHGAFMLHLMETLLGYDRDAYTERRNAQKKPWMPNAGICIFTYEDGVWQLQEEPMTADEYRLSHDPKTVYFTYVRHGETVFNKEKRLQGQCDSPLTEEGIQQAEEAGEKLKDISFVRAYTSPLERTYDTARYILAGRDIELSEDDRLKEVFFGNLEGSHFESKWDEILPMYMKVDYSSVNGETYRQVEKRMKSFFKEVYDASKDQDQILIVSHGEYYMCMLEMLFGMNREEVYAIAEREGVNPIPNCGICTWKYRDLEYQMMKRMDEIL